MRRNLAVRQTVVSALVFASLLLVLVLIDPRVREHMSDVAAIGNSAAPWTDRAGDLAGVLVIAVRSQSIEHAPLLIFAMVGAMLFLFMLRV